MVAAARTRRGRGGRGRPAGCRRGCAAPRATAAAIRAAPRRCAGTATPCCGRRALAPQRELLDRGVARSRQADHLRQGDDHLAQHLERPHLRASLPPVLQRLEEQPLHLAARGARPQPPQRAARAALTGGVGVDPGHEPAADRRGRGAADRSQLAASLRRARRRQRGRSDGARRPAVPRGRARRNGQHRHRVDCRKCRAPSRAPASIGNYLLRRAVVPEDRRARGRRLELPPVPLAAPSSSPTTASTTST